LSSNICVTLNCNLIPSLIYNKVKKEFQTNTSATETKYIPNRKKKWTKNQPHTRGINKKKESKRRENLYNGVRTNFPSTTEESIDEDSQIRNPKKQSTVHLS